MTSSTHEVLADLYEEVTGDPEKRWPPEWMAVVIARHVGLKDIGTHRVRGSRQMIGLTAVDLAVDAGVDPELIARGLNPPYPHGSLWVELQKDDFHRLLGDLVIAGLEDSTDGPVEYFQAEVVVWNRPSEGFLFIVPLVPVQFLARPDNWFMDRPYLKDTADFIGVTTKELTRVLTSRNPYILYGGYRAVGGRHGFGNFDDVGLYVTPDDIRRRWSDPPLSTNNWAGRRR